MGMAKRILRSNGGQRALARAAALYVRFVARTTRWTVDDTALQPLLDRDEPGILAFWHGRLLMMPIAWRGRPRPFHMMISEHRDGVLIARTIAHHGIQTTGSDSKTGGFAALREMKRRMDDGGWVGITPDGPRGPRMRAKPGAIKLAQLSGRAIVPVSLSLSRRRILGSWDRFLLAWPFGRGVIRFGEPIRVPRITDTETLENCRTRLEKVLNDLTAEADRLCGTPPVTPEDGTEAGLDEETSALTAAATGNGGQARA